MSKNIHLRDWNSGENNESKKQKCHNSADDKTGGDKPTMEASESVLLPETEDSFFTDAKLDKIIDQYKEQRANSVKNNRQRFCKEQTENCLFTDILPDNEQQSSGENVGGTPLTQNLPNADLFDNDTLFSEINIDELVAPGSNEVPEKAESVQSVLSSTMQDAINDMFKEDFPMDDVPQCTQKFLNDVAFKMPAPPETQKFFKLPLGGCIQGTQYETREEIENRSTLLLNQTCAAAQSNCSELLHLSNINWDTEMFDNEAKEAYPCKGDFFGLPDKVKKMIFDHKGIQKLYGKCN